MITPHLPVLQVILPLISAPLCVVLRLGMLAWGIATAASWLALLVAAQLLATVLPGGAISYDLGGWAAPWGIEYRIDAANAFVLLIVSGISAVVLSFGRASIEREIPREQLTLFYAAWLLCLAGLLGIAATGDAFNVFVFLEISSLSTYALISMGRDRRALTAAYQYLIMGTIGATFILIGVGLLYMVTGTLNMADLAERIPNVEAHRPVAAAFAFLTVGVCLKLALFPLHLWLPNAYAYAPSMVTAFVAATATKVAVYVLLRFFFTVFGYEFSFEVMPLGPSLIVLSVVAMIVASTVAIFQDNAKRLLAYSSVAQIGYITLGIGLGTAAGTAAGVIHLFNHALVKGGLFLAVACIMYRTGSVLIRDFAGLGRRMPLTMAAIVGGGLGLIGVPLTAGFVSKWYLIAAALEAGLWPLVVVIVISSLLAVIYVWRLIEVAYFREPVPNPDGSAPANVQEAPVMLLIATWLLVGANFYFGIDTSLTSAAASAAAQALFGVGS